MDNDQSNGRSAPVVPGSGRFNDDLELLNASWQAANFLSVGQIYVLDDPPLRVPLTRDHIKPRLLGRWRTTPGVNGIYAHLNRVVERDDLTWRATSSIA
jgi:xylulose-5-phosphate/fructose-6-phosphate phosphoketolase